MKLLALDIGSAQVKGVLFDAKFNRFDILRQETIEVGDALQPLENPSPNQLTPGQIAALTLLWDRYSKSVDRIVVNMPVSLYTSRVLSFPFSDKKKIRASTAFQIEDEVPFDIEDCVIANQIFPANQNGETQVLCGVSPTAELKAYFETLTSNTGIDPDVASSYQSATYAFLDRGVDIFGGKDIAVINLGHRTSTINTYRDRIPALNRTSMVGGYQITHAIAQSYSIGLPEAEQAKLQSGFLAPPGIEQSDEQRAFSDLIGIVLEPVFHDFYQVLMAHFSRHRERIKQIYVSGGTALLPGTCDYLAARWQVPVHPLKVSTTLPNQTLKTTTNMDLVLSPAIFMGLSQVEGRSRDAQNFRSGAARKEGGGLNINLKAIEKPLKVFGIAYTFIVISMILQSFLLGGQLARKDLRREAAIKAFFNSPKASAVYQLMINPDKLKREADAKLQETRGQYFGALEDPTFSPLSVLKEMSQAVPKTTVVEVRKLQMSTATAKIRLESPSVNDINAALKAISSIRAVSSVSEPVRETVNPSLQALTVDIKLKKAGL